jgi:hypothetical protein
VGVDQVKEWQRLTTLYSGKNDDELGELAEQFEDLTDTAQQTLRDELKKRGLNLPGEDRPAPSGIRPAKTFGAIDLSPERPEPESTMPASGRSEYSWKVMLCECGELEDAKDVMRMLELAGIESWYDGPTSPLSVVPYGPRVLVAADELERAQLILQKPIPQEIRDQTRTPVADFETPACARCGGLDPLLESVDPANTWLCEACGYTWTEPQLGAAK